VENRLFVYRHKSLHAKKEELAEPVAKTEEAVSA
jgi:hypothetical protein